METARKIVPNPALRMAFQSRVASTMIRIAREPANYAFPSIFEGRETASSRCPPPKWNGDGPAFQPCLEILTASMGASQKPSSDICKPGEVDGHFSCQNAIESFAVFWPESGQDGLKSCNPKQVL